MHGKVIESYSNGIYHGQMKNGKREWKGRYIWTMDGANGDIYVGE